jgi:hypothetical protein
VEIREIKKFEITVTPEDLKIIALVCLKIVGVDRKIGAIKKMREVCEGMRIVDEFGAPVMTPAQECPDCHNWNCPDAPQVPATMPGLKECKNAVDTWFDGRTFLG